MGRTRKKYNDSWMYILLLSTVVILAESVKAFNFTLMDAKLTFALFLLPCIYAITNYITKKYGFRRSFNAIIISSLSLIAFVMIMSFAIGKELNISGMSGQLLGYIISQLVSTLIYKFLLVNTNSPYLLVLLNYIFAYIVYYMVYTVVHLDMIILDTFWLSYFLALGIQTIISIGVTILDKKIEVGIGTDD